MPASVGSTVPSPAPVVIVNMFGGIVLAVAVSSDCNRYWLLFVSLDSVVAGLELGRQAAWRPRRIRIGVVWLVASCRQMLISVCLIGLGLWAQLGRQAAWRPRCIDRCRLVGGIVLAVAVVIACSWLWFWALARSSSCLAAEVHSIWCRLVGGIVFTVGVTGNCWDLGSGQGLNLVVWLFGDWCTIGLVDEGSISQWACLQ